MAAITPIVERGNSIHRQQGMRRRNVMRNGDEGLIDAAEFHGSQRRPRAPISSITTSLPLPASPPTRVRGLLFPDTYEVKQSGSDNPDAVIKIMLETMEDRSTPEMREEIARRQISGPATVYEALIIASIVQREGVVKDSWLISPRSSGTASTAACPERRPDHAIRAAPGEWWLHNPDPNTVEHPYNTYKFAGCYPGLSPIPGSTPCAQPCTLAE